MLPFLKTELEGSWSDWHENVILGGRKEGYLSLYGIGYLNYLIMGRG